MKKKRKTNKILVYLADAEFGDRVLGCHRATRARSPRVSQWTCWEWQRASWTTRHRSCCRRDSSCTPTRLERVWKASTRSPRCRTRSRSCRRCSRSPRVCSRPISHWDASRTTQPIWTPTVCARVVRRSRKSPNSSSWWTRPGHPGSTRKPSRSTPVYFHEHKQIK